LRRAQGGSVTEAVLLLGFVTVQRLTELAFARRNTRRLLLIGGIEHGAGHYPYIVALHALWLGGLWALAWERQIDVVWFCVFVVLQLLRAWILSTLGTRFTTRIITVPGEALVRRGPYRLMKHPNYALVIAEIAILPLVFGLWQFALGFSLLNAAALAIRIPAEEQALSDLRDGDRSSAI
jgi:methyltransferase